MSYEPNASGVKQLLRTITLLACVATVCLLLWQWGRGPIHIQAVQGLPTLRYDGLKLVEQDGPWKIQGTLVHDWELTEEMRREIRRQTGCWPRYGVDPCDVL